MWTMTMLRPAALLLVLAALGLSIPAAQAADACEITDLSCWGSHSKCNIKFRNKTGEASGWGGGTHNQTSDAMTIRVSARKANGNRAGNNSLTIDAGATNTLNLDKKDDFAYIRIDSRTGNTAKRVKMSCDDIRTVLSKDANCVMIHAQKKKRDQSGSSGTMTSDTFDYLAYSCAGKTVVSEVPVEPED